MPRENVKRFTEEEREELLRQLADARRVPFWLPWVLGGASATLTGLSSMLPQGSTGQIVCSALGMGVVAFTSALALSTRGTK